MEFVLTHQHNLLHIVVLSPVLTWAIILGALYGAFRLVVDLARFLRRNSAWRDLGDEYWRPRK